MTLVRILHTVYLGETDYCISTGKRACAYRTMSLLPTLVSKVLARVNSSWPNRRLVIALHWAPSPKRTISTIIARQRANEWGFSEILACALLRDFHHFAGKGD